MNERDIVLADTPRAFAENVVSLLRDASLRDELSRNARLAAEEYDWSRIVSEFRRIINALMSLNSGKTSR